MDCCVCHDRIQACVPSMQPGHITQACLPDDHQVQGPPPAVYQQQQQQQQQQQEQQEENNKNNINNKSVLFWICLIQQQVDKQG